MPLYGRIRPDWAFHRLPLPDPDGLRTGKTLVFANNPFEVVFPSRSNCIGSGSQKLPAFAQVSTTGLKLILSGPGASGSRPMQDGREQEPGGWIRIILRVNDLAGSIESLKKSGLHFRNEMEVGPGGKQIQLEDPDGNPIELFEPAQ